MSKARNTIVDRLAVAATLVLFMVARHPGVLSSAEAVKATVTVKHKPLKHFVAGHRVQIEAKVTDTQGVSLVRCYFRAAGQADYVFVGMKAGAKDMFTGMLPSPAAETKALEYLFLTVSGRNQVVKTQVFKTESKDTKDIPAWQSGGADGQVAVSTEVPQATTPAGFSDSIAVDVVESSLRFGSVAGIYGTLQIASGGDAAGGGTSASGSAPGTAAAATSAGTVAAAPGLSTMVIAGASAAVVAVGAGVAVASGGADDGGGGSDTARSACDQYAGNWSGESRGTSCYYDVVSKGYVWHDSLRMTVNSDCTALYCIAGCMDSEVQGDTVSFEGYDSKCGGGVNVTGRFTSPTSISGTYQENTGAGGTWSATKQ